MKRRNVIVIGAAGRDFHNFNTCYRDNPTYHVVAFTAALATLLACLHARSRSAGEVLAWALPLLTLATPVWWDETWTEPNALVQASLTWNPLAAFVGVARAAMG